MCGGGMLGRASGMRVPTSERHPAAVPVLPPSVRRPDGIGVRSRRREPAARTAPPISRARHLRDGT